MGAGQGFGEDETISASGIVTRRAKTAAGWLGGAGPPASLAVRQGEAGPSSIEPGPAVRGTPAPRSNGDCQIVFFQDPVVFEDGLFDFGDARLACFIRAARRGNHSCAKQAELAERYELEL